ncbi:MAG: ADP-ribose pyrophosphatase [Rhodothalassiaceae bacterium]|nr:MAG: ADP-ribose pyrophosphatase [Rhodothalassiaceae bacterium]
MSAADRDAGRGGAGAALAPDFARIVPDGDNRVREVCRHCGFVHYVNPKIVVGALVVEEDRLLLCRRAIEPRAGYWTMPAGFLEVGETLEDGARREAREEAEADLVLERLLAVYSLPHISQVQIFYLAHLAAPSFAPGPESREVRLFAIADIPWAALAFPSVEWTIRAWLADREEGRARLHTSPPPGFDIAEWLRAHS